MPNDPLAKFRREPRPASKDDQVQEPLTEHEALGLAIVALSQTPNVYLPYGDYSDTSKLITVLNEVYEGAEMREAYERAEEENLLKEAYERRKWIPAFTNKSAPEPEITREADIEPEM